MEGSERRGLSRRIAVVGTSGSGKTTLAHRLAQQLGIPHVELDALYWDPNWTPAPPDLFRERAAEALSGQTWTADGNYSTVRDIVWKRADTVVWLDYSLPVIMGRVTWRTLRRSIGREELWNENRERLQEALLSRDSIVWWALRTYHRRKKEFPNLFSLPEYAHLNVVHLRSPQAAREWLSTQGAMPGERQPVPD
jgi:adenylate kinase family enzyme